MKDRPRIGEIGQIDFQVSQQHVIDFADERMPAVLCTPWLIWFLEHAAREAMLAYLEESESTVGVVVDVQHLAATPVGTSVTCKARIIHSDDKLFTFQMEAHDGFEQIARGLHKLRVISKDRFAARLQAKTGGAGGETG